MSKALGIVVLLVGCQRPVDEPACVRDVMALANQACRGREGPIAPQGRMRVFAKYDDCMREWRAEAADTCAKPIEPMVGGMPDDFATDACALIMIAQFEACVEDMSRTALFSCSAGLRHDGVELEDQTVEGQASCRDGWRDGSPGGAMPGYLERCALESFDPARCSGDRLTCNERRTSFAVTACREGLLANGERVCMMPNERANYLCVSTWLRDQRRIATCGE